MTIAEKWALPPWEIEEQITQEWYDRFIAYENLVAAERARKAKQRKSATPRGRK